MIFEGFDVRWRMMLFYFTLSPQQTFCLLLSSQLSTQLEDKRNEERKSEKKKTHFQNKENLSANSYSVTRFCTKISIRLEPP